MLESFASGREENGKLNEKEQKRTLGGDGYSAHLVWVVPMWYIQLSRAIKQNN